MAKIPLLQNLDMQSLTTSEQLDDLGCFVSAQQFFAALGVFDGCREIGEDMEIFDLALFRSANHEDEIHRGAVQGLPFDAFFFLECRSR